MGLISVDLKCGICEYAWDELVQRPPADYGVTAYVCVECGAEAYRILSVPNNLRASHPDGYSKGPGYQAVKEAARLRAARANLPNTDAARADINSEIRKVEKAAGRGYVKREKGQK